jgi:hypothetical protein
MEKTVARRKALQSEWEGNNHAAIQQIEGWGSWTQNFEKMYVQ